MSGKTTNRRAVGDAAEQTAADYLRRKGARVLARNYFCRGGEIDLIARDGGVVAFVEVRRRRRLQDAADSIDEIKQRRIQCAAEHYLSQHDGGEHWRCRFDAVLVDENGKLRWIKDAFWAAGD